MLPFVRKPGFSRGCGAAALLALVLAALGAAFFLGLRFSARHPAESFVAYATRLSGTTRLQVATLRSVEVFRLEDPASLLGIPLPEVIVEARAPVETTWYLDLDARWEVRRRNGVLEITAPPLQFNTPAFDVARLEYRTVKSSLWRRETPVVDKLRAALGPMARRAAAAQLPQVRDTARAQVALFVRAWILQEDATREPEIVQVRFAGEPPLLPHAPARD